MAREQRSNSAMNETLEKEGLQRTPSGFIQWRSGTAGHPRNWSAKRKAYDCSIIIATEFFTTVISTAAPSAARLASKEYGLSSVVTLVAFLFMYQLGQALGGLIMPPYSELFGRRPQYLIASSTYSVSCMVVGVVPSVAGAFVGRFFSGFASSVFATVVAGSIEELFDVKMRIWLILAWQSATTAGLTVGPVYGSFIAEAIGWRWIFYIAAVVMAVLAVLLFFIRESRPSKLLEKQTSRLREATGRDDLRIHNPDAEKTLPAVLGRPLRLLVAEPIVILVTLLSATSWGLIYLFTESLTIVYHSFGFSESHASLAFIAVGLGILLSVLPRFWDMHVLNDRHKRHVSVEPEDKLIGLPFAAVALTVGLWLFAWTIPPLVPNIHWIVSMIGLVPIGFAANEIAYTLSGYLTDAYTVYSSSALASLAFLRALVAGAMPLFATQMYTGLGSNVATSIIAAVATCFCVAPFIFLRYGKRLREGSKFARYSVEQKRRTQVEDG